MFGLLVPAVRHEDADGPANRIAAARPSTVPLTARLSQGLAALVRTLGSKR